MADPMQILFDRPLVHLPDFVHDVACLMGPAQLHRDVPEHQWQRGLESLASIGDDQL